jgi:hypothetical protein
MQITTIGLDLAKSVFQVLFRLGGLCAKASLVEGRLGAIWLPLVGASLLRKDVLQGRESV